MKALARRVFWRLDTRLRLRVRTEFAIHDAAKLLPRGVRRAVIVNAAVKAREPEMRPGGGYCGPDGLTYGDLWEAA